MLHRHIEQCPQLYDCVPNYTNPVLPTEDVIEAIEKAVIGKLVAAVGKLSKMAWYTAKMDLLSVTIIRSHIPELSKCIK